MQTVLEYVRQILGEPEFYTRLSSSTNYSWDYGLMIEYLVSALLLLVVVSSIFKFLRLLIQG